MIELYIVTSRKDLGWNFSFSFSFSDMPPSHCSRATSTATTLVKRGSMDQVLRSQAKSTT
jgi:hypothetical protein